MILMPLLFYVPAMIGVLVWNIAACIIVRRSKDLYPRWGRWCCYIATVLMLPGLVCDVGGMTPKEPVTTFGPWLYPLSFVMAAGAAIAFRSTSGSRRWFTPILAFNLLMAWVYSARLLLYHGVPLGLAFEGQQVAYSMVQSVMTTFLYVFIPILNWWPVLPWPVLSVKSRWRVLRRIPSIAAALIVSANIVLTPFGIRIAGSWRNPLPRASASLPSSFRPGIVLRVSAEPGAWEKRAPVQLAAIRELHPRAVNLFVHDDLMRNPVKAEALERFIQEIKATGPAIILTADYPTNWPLHPPKTREQILRVMLPYQRFLARRYEPEYLVPFIEPYGAFVAVTGRTLPASEWMALLRASAAAVHSGSPMVRCAVYLGQAENDRLLYRQLCMTGSPVDVVGFSFYAVYQTREETTPRLRSVARWIRDYGRGRENWVFEYGQSPVTMGGERSQRNYVEYVMRWAADQPNMRGACVFSLDDEAEKLGLMTAQGRKREVYQWFLSLR
ncbi:MAG: glycoside hydrolase family protein [Armatimonadota bacterium]